MLGARSGGETLVTNGESSARVSVRARLTAQLAGAALPLRRTLSRVVLVYEERYFRDVAVNGVYAALAAQGAKLGDSLRGIEERVVQRVDILMEELWRRTESVGARQATELQRLAARLQHVERSSQAQAPELEHLARSMAEVHQLAAEMAAIRLLGVSVATDPRAARATVRGPLMAELERGIRPGPRERWEPHLKHLHGLSPLVALGRGGDEFAGLAAETGLTVSPVAGPGYLTGLDAGSLGGSFTSLVTHPLAPEELERLLAGIARALQPDGVAVIESPNPASFASFLQSSGLLTGDTPGATLPPDLLADHAQAAGLEVEECRYSPLPARHLAGVNGDLADPALREIAVGVNELVGQLNDVLYGPQDYVLILRKP